MSLMEPAKVIENYAVTFRKSETVINCFRPQLILVQRIRLCIYMCSNDEGIGSQMSSSVRHLERMMEQLLHCTPAFYTSVKFKTVTAKSSGVVSSVAHEVNQPLVRWKCNFFHFQEEQSGRDHFNNFLRLLCYNIRDLFLLCYSFPS